MNQASKKGRKSGGVDRGRGKCSSAGAGIVYCGNAVSIDTVEEGRSRAINVKPNIF